MRACHVPVEKVLKFIRHGKRIEEGIILHVARSLLLRLLCNVHVKSDTSCTNTGIYDISMRGIVYSVERRRK